MGINKKRKHMKHQFHILVLLAAISATISCGNHTSGQGDLSWEDMTIEQKFEVMRTDSVWIHKLDSLAAVHIGPGAKCLDAVKHNFSFDGRLFVYNQDWGGVLEIPSGFVPADDTWQLELSYHGAPVISPDSLVYISHYEGFQGCDYDEFLQCSKESFARDSLMVKVDMREEDITFGSGFKSPVLVFETLNKDGIKGYFRHVFTSPEGVEFSASVQYPQDCEEQYAYIRDMIVHYPFGPAGQDPKMMQ